MSDTERIITQTIQFSDKSRLTIKMAAVPGDGDHEANQAYQKLLTVVKEIEQSQVNVETEELRGWCRICHSTTWHRLREGAWFCEVCSTKSAHSLDSLL